MAVKNLKLHAIRAYKDASVSFSDGMSVFVGPNGAGKTTLLEAISVLATLRSFKTSRIKDLVREDEEVGQIQSEIGSPNRKLKIRIRQHSRELFLDEKKAPSGAKFCSVFSVVALAPEHHKLFSGSSEERRTFLDRSLFATDPSYVDIAQRYRKAIRQKQALFRQELPFAVFEDQVSPWNNEIAAYGSEIRQKRLKRAQDLEPVARKLHSELASRRGELSFKYECGDQEIEEELLDRMVSEHAAGRTLVGPHRDDLSIQLNGKLADTVASQGERSSILVSMKLAEIDLIETARDHPPTLLLDDLGATLDANRRESLLGLLQAKKYQTLVTTADKHIADAAVETGAQAFRQENTQGSGGFSIASWVPK